MSELRFTEVVKVKDGVFVDLHLNISRLHRTAQRFFGTAPQIELTAKQIPQNLRQGLVMCRIVYDSKILSVEFEPYQFRSISKLTIVYDSSIDYEFKYFDRSALNSLMASKGEGDDILIVKNELVTDTSFSNVVFKSTEGKLITPLKPLFKGVKRERLLRQGVINECDIPVRDIHNYSGLYLINAMIDIEDDMFVASCNIF